jgi:toxin CcdB
MARFDLFQISGVEGLLLEVQADFMSGLATTVVVPLRPVETRPRPMSRLNPIFEIGGMRYVMETQSLGAVPRKQLGPTIGSLGTGAYDEVVRALDMLFLGF